jgi:3-oxoacyl-[acyl-carrier protein] reductase
MNIRSKIAIVTGANSGIGKAIATGLARAGARIVLAGRRQEKNQEVANELVQQYGAETLAMQTDVTREADGNRWVHETVTVLGTVDSLVNNAGVGGGQRLALTDTEEFDRVMKTNLYGTFWCSRAAYRQMQTNNHNRRHEPKGAIINISSIAGKEAWSGTGTYSASKFGIQALTQAMADEGKEENIKVAAVCPARVATPMTGVSGPDYIQPEDCAATVLYLLRLSPAAWPTEIVLPRKGAE